MCNNVTNSVLKFAGKIKMLTLITRFNVFNYFNAIENEYLKFTISSLEYELLINLQWVDCNYCF